MNRAFSQEVHLLYPVTKTLERDPSVPSPPGPSGDPTRPLPVFGGRIPFTDTIMKKRQHLVEGRAVDASHWNLRLVSEVDGGAALLTRFDGAVMSGFMSNLLDSTGGFQEQVTGEIKLPFEGWVLQKVRTESRGTNGLHYPTSPPPDSAPVFHAPPSQWL
jgi:hypothetical protein